MALKIRLRQQGRKNRTSYRLVVADVRAPRDGKYLEALGWYNPLEQEGKQLGLHEDRIQHWLAHGAELSENATSVIKKGAPAVIQQHTEKQLAQRAKERLKRRGSKVAEEKPKKSVKASKPATEEKKKATKRPAKKASGETS
jgi:small subunit ribosomal protein S16